MKKTAFVATLTAALLAFGSVALAQSGDSRPGPGPKPHMQDGPGHGPKPMHGHPEKPHKPKGPHGMHGHPPMEQAGHPGPGFESRGAGPDHNFNKGGRLPQEYRNRQYVVDDWRGHHLSAPPRGYQWVQTGGDYVLVAIATGIIAQILLSQ